jgi:exopolysaccharide biosynthesis polyprenyl glycosylphosphotransferase
VAIAEKQTVPGALIQRSFAAPPRWQPKLFQLVVDLMVAFVAAAAAAELLPAGPDERVVTGVLLVAWAAFLAKARLYTARFITRRSDEIRRTFDASVAAGACTAVVAFLGRFEVGRGWLLVSVLFGSSALVVERELVRRSYERRRQSGNLTRRVLMVGNNSESGALEEMFASDAKLGYEVVGTVDPSADGDRHQLTTRVLALAHKYDASTAIVAASAIESAVSNRLIRDLMEAGMHVELSSTLTDIDPQRLTVRPLGRFPVVYVEPIRRTGWRALAKRTFDVALAALGLLIVSPLAAGAAVAVRLSSPGPIIFRQTRVGLNGAPFQVLKFRTMSADAEETLGELAGANEGAGPLFKMKDDPRVTGIGRFLRRTSLDELPQLWNVLRGEMSLVGPRPALASEMAAWDEDLYGRLRVRPGITGMWQVSGRSEASFEEYTRLDLYYVDNWSLVVDLIILARTIPAVFSSSGAY